MYCIYLLLEVLNTIPSTRTKIPPAVPIRLIIALPLERRGLTVTSGISATAGERKIAIEMSVRRSTATKLIIGQRLASVISSVSAIMRSISALIAVIDFCIASTAAASPALPAALSAAFASSSIAEEMENLSGIPAFMTEVSW